MQNIKIKEWEEYFETYETLQKQVAVVLFDVQIIDYREVDNITFEEFQ